MSTTKNVIKKRAYKRKATKTESTSKDKAIPILKTVITIDTDGVITIEKTESAISEEMTTKEK